MDGILISGKDHLANLGAVLKKLSAAGPRLRLEKCFFMVPGVTYCGYAINGSGIKPVAAKPCKTPQPLKMSDSCMHFWE